MRQFGQGEDVTGRTNANADRLVGGGLAMNVTWKGQAPLKYEGKPVILRLQLKHAKLFAVELY